MKKIILFLTIFMFAHSASNAQYVNIPDTAFGKFLIAKYPTCLYWDTLPNKYYLDTICSINIVSSPYDVWFPSCNSLEGIQYFKTLKSLYVSGNPIATWSKLPESLDTLGYTNSTSTNLPPLPSHLKVLYCENNKLSSLPQLPISLRIIYCSNNLLSSISALPDSLMFLYCSKIVRNAAISIIRTKKTEKTTQELTYDLQLETSINPFENESNETVTKYLKTLTLTTRAVFNLFYVEGFLIKEIAINLDMKEGTVKWHLNDGRNKLKTYFNSNIKNELYAKEV